MKRTPTRRQQELRAKLRRPPVYDPPLSADEIQRRKEMLIAHFDRALAAGRVTKADWLEAMRSLYQWVESKLNLLPPTER